LSEKEAGEGAVFVKFASLPGIHGASLGWVDLASTFNYNSSLYYWCTMEHQVPNNRNQKWNLKESCSWRAGFAAFGQPKSGELWMPT
jgi:hypothetical protein